MNATGAGKSARAGFFVLPLAFGYEWFAEGRASRSALKYNGLCGKDLKIAGVHVVVGGVLFLVIRNDTLDVRF